MKTILKRNENNLEKKVIKIVKTMEKKVIKIVKEIKIILKRELEYSKEKGNLS